MRIILALLGAGLAVLGLLLTVHPEKYYDFAHRWEHKESTGPSEAFLTDTRIGGVVTFLFGVAAVIRAFI